MGGQISRRRELTPENMHPMHYALLKALPDEGTVLGLHRIGKTSRQLAGEINQQITPEERKVVGVVSAGSVAAILRSMEKAGLTVAFKMIRQHHHIGYQRTSKGKALVK